MKKFQKGCIGTMYKWNVRTTFWLYIYIEHRIWRPSRGQHIESEYLRDLLLTTATKGVSSGLWDKLINSNDQLLFTDIVDTVCLDIGSLYDILDLRWSVDRRSLNSRYDYYGKSTIG